MNITVPKLSTTPNCLPFVPLVQVGMIGTAGIIPVPALAMVAMAAG